MTTVFSAKILKLSDFVKAKNTASFAWGEVREKPGH